MEEFETISYKELKLKNGEIVVLARYGKNAIVKNVGFKCAKDGSNILAFVRETYAEELYEKLSNEECGGEFYVTNQKASIERIEHICKNIMPEFGRFFVMIDFADTIDYTEEEIKQLKQLCEELRLLIIITTEIKETPLSPTLSDINNKPLEDVADVVVLETNDQAIMVKNKFGKIGILDLEENNYE